MHVVAIVGSLRKGSYNRLLLRAAIEVAPAGLEIEEASIADIPLYDGDVEANAYPAAVTALKERIVAAHAVLLVTPEYNHSIPGVLKNVIDWTSRPGRDIPRVWGDKPVGVMGAGGPGGTRVAQVAWLPVLRVLGTRPYFGKIVVVANAPSQFDADGRLVDEKTRGFVTAFMEGFGKFVGTSE